MMSAGEAAAAPLAFPGAEGFAAMVTGGRKGQVVHVTTLADSGAGSLRDAVSGSNRIVVFDISGVIKPTDIIVVAGDNITLAGQSAPGDGITIYGREISFSNRKNIIVRYLRFRQGMTDASGSAKKTVNITDGQSMIFDHVSIQWGRWDNFGITGTSSTVTLQNSIIGEGVPPQNFGSIIDGEQDITIAHNLWIDNNERNPKFKANGECTNNVVYNWGTGGGIIGGHSGTDWYEDYINNYLIAGPSAVAKFFTFYTNTDHAYQTGNMVDVNKDGQLNGRAVVNADFEGTSPPTFETAAHSKPPVPVTVLSAEDAYARVVAQAGTCQHRDAVELRLVAQLTSLGTKGAIIANESDVGGQPAMTQVTRPAGFDTDGDGIPDTWETAHGLNPNSASDGAGDYNGDGYTNVEKYLNELADLACPGGASPTPSDAGIPKPTDGATLGVDAGPTPGRDAGFLAGPDAPILGSDAPALRLDAGSPGSDTSATRPDAASPASDAPVATPGSDASTPSPDAASPGADVTTSRPDLAVVATDVAVLPVDAVSIPPSDAAPSAADGRVSGIPDAPVQASAGPDAAGADSGSTTGPATAASGCSCSTGSGRSRDHLGFLPLAVGLLFVVRRWSVRRRR
jgi:MYXO-CTERM domain-containing protein